MHRNSRFLFLLLALLFLPLLFSDARKDALLGGWTPIENVKDPHVTEIAKFAVAEYNKQSKTSLKLLKVIKGETQVVAGTNYRLVLKATDGSATKAYEAVVWEKAWQNFRNLTSFNPVKG
ncbi:cysteine proteinase inhibitor 5-like [Durio zibethinus]|uniref:Cysteine proteinase inhibitor 5-like n=1 Tax=Durio zibethinus TaxID=66656 RepID=A0A6P5X7S6_DURZI|nr:cysteine proteinase inhibitor 5-like [Durio zibethinus]